MPRKNNSKIQSVRFYGVLDERNSFVRLPGFSLDENTKKASKGKNAYRVVLKNSNGRILSSFVPDIDFELEGCLMSGELKRSIVEADIEMKEEGESIALLHDEEVLYEERVIDKEPVLKDISVEAFKGRKIPQPQMGRYGVACNVDELDTRMLRDAKLVKVDWKFKRQDKDDYVDILLLSSSGIHREIATNLIKGPFVINLAGMKSKYVNIVVRASNGFRSTSLVSKKIPTKSISPKLDILEPNDNVSVTAYTPFDLRASVTDPRSKNPQKRLIWMLGNNIIQRGGDLALVEGLNPGRHRIRVFYVNNRRQRLSSQITVNVPKPNKDHALWLTQAERF